MHVFVRHDGSTTSVDVPVAASAGWLMRCLVNSSTNMVRALTSSW